MDKRIILYIIAGILILGLLILTFFPGMVYVITDSSSFGENSNGDKCSAPQGYAEEEWIEHMSHHPSMYQECLN
jgi:hypothetical protein